MSPKRGDRVTVPPEDGWDVVYGSSAAVEGWDELCRVALANTRRCLDVLRHRPDAPEDWTRQHTLRGLLATKDWKGTSLQQWEYEVTSGGRVRYLVSPETRTVIIVYASPRHPKDTE